MFVLTERPGYIVSHFYCNNVMLFDENMLLVLLFCDRVMLDHFQ